MIFFGGKRPLLELYFNDVNSNCQRKVPRNCFIEGNA